MTTIKTNNDFVTLINVFTVKPENQQPLLDMFAKETEEFIQDLPGFISANFHASEDGTRIVNYAQWRSREDIEAMEEMPEFKEKVKANEQLCEEYDDKLYSVASTFAADSSNADSSN